MFFYRDITYNSVQIGADGYGSADIRLAEDENVIGASILTWGSGVLYGGPTIGNKGGGYGYILGKPNSTITGLSIRWLLRTII